MAVTAPTWTILVATLGQRQDLLRRMLDGLLPQVVAADGRVKVLAYWDNGQASIAAKRQALLDAADSDYVSFVDDDDTVSDDYVSAVLTALRQRRDYIGFKLTVYQDGHRLGTSHHSLRYGGWVNRGGDYFRDITHINPMRTDIAQAARFDLTVPGQPEDTTWVAQLRGRLVSEVFIPRVLYHYWWVPSQSTWTTPGRIRTTQPSGYVWQPPAVDSPHFAWHPASPRRVSR